MTVREQLDEYDGELLVADGFDDAIVGLAEVFHNTVVAYDKGKCIDILAQDMSREDAEEYFEFNVQGAYVGALTPAFITMMEPLP